MSTIEATKENLVIIYDCSIRVSREGVNLLKLKVVRFYPIAMPMILQETKLLNFSRLS